MVEMAMKSRDGIHECYSISPKSENATIKEQALFSHMHVPYRHNLDTIGRHHGSVIKSSMYKIW